SRTSTRAAGSCTRRRCCSRWSRRAARARRRTGSCRAPGWAPGGRAARSAIICWRVTRCGSGSARRSSTRSWIHRGTWCTRTRSSSGSNGCERGMELLDGLTKVKQGKVRDMYRTQAGIVMVASDRISAYDVVLPTPIPDKGAVLTGLSAYWFDRTADIVPNHMISTQPDDYPPEAKQHAAELRGRSMLVREAEPVPIECVARGYITGSGWK